MNQWEGPSRKQVNESSTATDKSNFLHVLSECMTFSLRILADRFKLSEFIEAQEVHWKHFLCTKFQMHRRIDSTNESRLVIIKIRLSSFYDEDWWCEMFLIWMYRPHIKIWCGKYIKYLYPYGTEILDSFYRQRYQKALLIGHMRRNSRILHDWSFLFLKRRIE